MYAGSLHGFFMAAAVLADNDPVTGDIEFIGAASADGTTVTMPVHQTGDLLVIWAWNDGGTDPADPAGWTTVAAASRLGAGSKCHRLAYKVAASGSETSGTWTNADSVHVHVYRNASGIGAGNRGVDNSSSAAIPSLTLNVTDGSSWVAAFAMTDGSIVDMTADGMTARTANFVSASDKAESWDTNAGVASFAGDSNLGSGTTSWASSVAEILAT